MQILPCCRAFSSEQFAVMDDSQKIAELEQRLVLLEDELMRAQRLSSVGALASSITHEFNNILTVIQGHLSLQLDSGVLTDDTRASLLTAFSASERAAAGGSSAARTIRPS